MENTFDDFNWDSMKDQVGNDPFADTSKKYEEDTRFFKLTKDDKGNGAAVIRFLPDADRNTIQKMYKIGTTIIKDGKKRFLNEWSPTTIGLPCPFQERWSKLWGEGNKDEAMYFSRGKGRFIANIKVINDIGNPENNGKIFLLDMSPTFAKKIQEALEPSETAIQLGETPKQLFNPMQGNSFKYACTIGTNNITSYDPSSVIAEKTAIYDTVEAAVTDIAENTHSLNELIKPESFLSYAELEKKLAWVTHSEAPSGTAEVAKVAPAETAETLQAAPVETDQVVEVAAPVETVTQPAQEAPADSNADLDAMLAQLSK